VVICLERGADWHMAQLMPRHSLSLASVKSRLVLPFLGSPGQRAVKRVCACVRACVRVCVCVDLVEFDKSVDAQKREDLLVAHVGEDLARRVEWNHTDHVGHKPLAAHVVANHVLPHRRDACTVARAVAVVVLLGQLSLASLRGRLIEYQLRLG